MIFIIRSDTPPPADFALKMRRRTPGAGTVDFFCTGDADAARRLGLAVVAVHDGWYADDTGGGVAVFGQGRFWEVRDTPFTVREADGGIATIGTAAPQTEVINVRNAIFGVS
jgi:hypothetical protein